MYVFEVDVDNSKLNYRGLITHPDVYSTERYYFSNAIVRGVIIDSKIYTISQSFVGINLLDDNLTLIKNIPLMYSRK